MQIRWLWLSMLPAIFSCSKSSSNQNAPAVNPPLTPPPVVKPYQLVWDDEFDSPGKPDSSKWTYDIGMGFNGWGNQEQEYYTDSSSNLRVENGNLVISAKNENYTGASYTSGRLVSRGKAQWTYGKFEIRARLPRGVGTWPAIWLLSATQPLSWPADGEIDIMEEVGFDSLNVHGTCHNQTYFGANGKGSKVNVPNLADSFHVFSVEWTGSQISWAVDSAIYYTYTNPGSGFAVWPYDLDFYIILNLAIGGSWGGQQGIDNAVFPQQMLVDYVRIYQRK